MIDVTIDKGSSGGPLVNSKGEVVAITTAGQRGSFGFAIPINQAIPLLERIQGFRTAELGQATSEMTFREIREQVGIGTTFVEAVQNQEITLPASYGDVSSELLFPEDAIVGYMSGTGSLRNQSRVVDETDVTFKRRTHVSVYQMTTPEQAMRSSSRLTEGSNGDDYYRARDTIEAGEVTRRIYHRTYSSL